MLCNEMHRFLFFFKKLSFTERLSFISRFVLTLFSLALLFSLQNKISMRPDQIYITVFCLSVSFIAFGRIPFLLIQLPTAFICLADWHLYRMYGLSVSSIGAFLTAVLQDTNKTEVIEYLSKISPLEFILLLILPVLSVLSLFYKPPRFTRMLYVLTFLIFPFSFAGNLAYIVKYRFASNEQSTLESVSRFKFDAKLGTENADTVIVLIGETHRNDFFSPAFKKYRNKYNSLFYFNDFTSSYSNTLYTVPMLLSRKKFKDKEMFFPEKSLFSLYKEAGYSTYFLHYVETAKEKSTVSFIYNEAENFILYKPVPPLKQHDSGILPELKKIMHSDKRKKLIVIKMMGVHDNFDARYPADFDIRRPSFKAKETSSFFSKIKQAGENVLLAYKKHHIKNKQIFLNTYQNAMDYSVSVIDSLLAETKASPSASVLLFSSDHGICIYDKGYFQMPPDCKQAFHIPAMIYLNPAMAAKTSLQTQEMLTGNTKAPLTQEYIFETLVSLSGITYPAADASYDLTKQCNPLKNAKRPVEILSPDKKPAWYEDL